MSLPSTVAQVAPGLPNPTLAGPTPIARHAAAAAVPPTERHRLLVGLEDAVLVLVIVFMVPVIMLLLASPFALILFIAGEVARRW